MKGFLSDGVWRSVGPQLVTSRWSIFEADKSKVKVPKPSSNLQWQGTAEVPDTPNFQTESIIFRQIYTPSLQDKVFHTDGCIKKMGRVVQLWILYKEDTQELKKHTISELKKDIVYKFLRRGYTEEARRIAQEGLDETI